MISFAMSILLAVLCVVLTKGSFRRLAQIRFRLLWCLFIALTIQIALEVVTFPANRIEDLGFGILLATYLLIFVFCFANRRIKGMAIITLGIGLNFLVIALNQGMPTKDEVVERNGREVHVPIEQTVKHRPENSGDLLGFLGDVITGPSQNEQFSIGDIVIALGIVDLCFEGSRVPRRRDRTRPAEAQQG